MLFVAGTPRPCSRAARRSPPRSARRDLARAVPPRALLAFLDPWDDAQGTGFQTVQAMIGLGSGGSSASASGRASQKIFYLPEAHTDMIFAIIGEELGSSASTAVIAAYAAPRVRRPQGSRSRAATRSGSSSPPA